MSKEKNIEQYLREEVKKIGGRAYKFVSPGNAGVPDRLVLFPDGRIAFVEMKAPGKKPTALQQVQQKRIAGLGFKVFNLDSVHAVDVFIQFYGEEKKV